MSLAAECLVSVTGIMSPRRVRRADGKEAARVPLEWRREAREWLEQAGERKFRLGPRPDHERTLDSLTRGISTEELADITAELEPEAAADYAAQLSNAREYLRARWPALALDTPAGPRLLEPSRSALGEAYAILAVLDRPARVLDEMRMGTLQPPQVDALAAVFPGLLGMLQALVQEEILRQVANRRSWSMPWPKERIWRALLGLQPELPLSEAVQPPARMANPAPIEIDFRSQASKADRLDAL